MTKHYKKVAKLPEAIKPATSKKDEVFTDELVEELKDNPGDWYLVETATAVGAAAWLKRANGTFKGDGDRDYAKDGPFRAKSINTGKTAPDKNGKERARPEVFVQFKP